MRDLSALWKGETAAATVEYALLLSLVAIAALGAFMALGRGIEGVLVGTTEDISRQPGS